MNYVVDEIFTLAAAIEDNSASEDGTANYDAVTDKSESTKALRLNDDARLTIHGKSASSTPQPSPFSSSPSPACSSSTTFASSATWGSKSHNNALTTRLGANSAAYSPNLPSRSNNSKESSQR